MNQVEIVVEPSYLAEHSDVMGNHYLFAYHITIRNLSNNTITLRHRYWEITNAHGEVETVQGAGVVGEQPTLYPDDDFAYSSGAHLRTPWGSMQGYYEFEDESGDCFHVPIPRFELKADLTLH